MPSRAATIRQPAPTDGTRILETIEKPVRQAADRLERPFRSRRKSRLSRLAPGLAAGGLAALLRERRLRVGGMEVREARPTPMGALLRGTAAGLVGNAAMDATQMIVYKLRGKETGNWQSWDDAPMPAQVGKRVYEGVFQREAPPPNPTTIGNFQRAVHWAYGPAWAGLYGRVEASLTRRRPLLHGTVFGLFMWALGSGVMGPATKLAKPPWQYPLKTNALDVGYHLAYGLGVGGAVHALRRRY